MPKKKRKSESSGGAPAWMTTFGDMMSLLLTFFILIVSFSSIQDVEFQKAIGSLKGALGVLESRRSTVALASLKNIPIDVQHLALIMPEMQRLRALIKEQDLGNSVDIEPLPKAVKFTLQDKILFDLGKANLKPVIFPLLLQIVKIARKTKGVLRIEGHTDDLPIKTGQFPSNWELSSMRAISVLHYFEDLGIPRARLSCVGYADTRPVVPNTSPENRAKNRRVEIYLEIGNDVNFDENPFQELDPFQFKLPDHETSRRLTGSQKDGRKR